MGKNLIQKLSKKYDFTAIVRPNSQVAEIEKDCKIYPYDGNLPQLISLFQQEKFDGILHLATQYYPAHTEKELPLILRANINFGVEILESIQQMNSPCFFINTITFSQFATPPHYSPASLYDATKQAFSDIVRYYSIQLPDCLFSNLMLFNTYGPNDTRPKIFNLWKKSADSQTPLEMSEGNQLLDFSHIDDVIHGFDIFIHLCKQGQIPNNSTFMLQNERYSLKDLALIFMEVLNAQIPIHWGAKPYRTNEIFNPISEQSSQFKKLPTWQPRISIREGIKKVYG